jgi:hypothetical protein
MIDILTFNELDYLTTLTSLSPIRHGFALGFVNYKKGALDSQPQVIKFTICWPMVGGSLRVLQLLPPLKLVAMIENSKFKISYIKMYSVKRALFEIFLPA